MAASLYCLFFPTEIPSVQMYRGPVQPILLLLWLLIAAGCGQKGPLYLPGEAVPEATEQGLPEPTTVEILEGTPEGIEESSTKQPAQP